METIYDAVIKNRLLDRAIGTAFFVAIFAAMAGWLYLLFRIADTLIARLS